RHGGDGRARRPVEARPAATRRRHRPLPRGHARRGVRRRPGARRAPSAVTIVRSPLPGVFYRRPNPESDPYAVEGDHVSVGDVVGLIEIMKTFHEVISDAEGTVERFLADDGALVDVGQDLLELL